MTNVIQSPNQHFTSQEEWWLVYDSSTRNIIVELQQCTGFTSSPFTMVTSDSLQEIEEYIIDNNLSIIK